MKRRIAKLLVVMAALTLVVTACGDDEGGDGEAFRIAVVAPSASNDLAFTQSIVDAVNAIQEEMGGEDAIEIAITDTTSERVVSLQKSAVNSASIRCASPNGAWRVIHESSDPQ